MSAHRSGDARPGAWNPRIAVRMGAQRVAVVDLGTNSTRLLVADVEDGAVREIERRTNVTRLGEGVDSSGRLSDPAMERVLDVLAQYRRLINDLGAGRVGAVATSAMRDAENGPEFQRLLAERFGIEARVIPGEEEARLTFRGATSARGDRDAETSVVDIGGGSTEFVVGEPERDPRFHVSTKLGSVRQSERHLHSDPPAAIDLELDPYDPERVHGHVLGLGPAESILERLAQLPLAERREVTGLHPDRAPTIVAGAAILVQSMLAFGLRAIEVSEADLLHGGALALAERH